MSCPTLLVQVELGRANAAPLKVARDVATRLHARVCGIAAAMPLQILVGDGFYGVDIMREDGAAIESEALTAEAEFRSTLNGHPEGTEWDMAVTRFPLSDRIAEAACTADLIVTGVAQAGEEPSNSSRRVDIDDLIMQAGRPVLAVPLGIRQFAFGTALVAWKDTREARRAVVDALPVLREMERVVIASLADAAEQGPAQAGLHRMVAWLGRQGVSATPRLVLSNGNDGDRLLSLAEEERAELIVAGAYGHSRIREWVMGGVTRTLLRQGGRCLLLSH